MLRVSILGEQAITDDECIDLRVHTRAITLVGYLATHAGAPQSRQRIAGILWPESSDAQALTNLRRELHHLRQAVGENPALVVTPTSLAWQDTDSTEVDLRSFDTERVAALDARERGDSDGLVRHGTAAIGYYRGDFLPGGYDDWILQARQDLESRCVELCMLVCQARLQRGDLQGALTVARRRIALRPLEEEAYRVLMEIQAELGDRAGAVSTYHHCASVLERELGIIPDQATRATLQRLLTQGEPDAGAIVTAGQPGARVGTAGSPLIGRGREHAVLQSLWDGAAVGRPALVVVRGGAGVGKTRLVTDVAKSAELRGAVVAIAQCFGAAGRLPLAPVADWLRNPDVRGAISSLDPIWRAEVERLTPSGDRLPGEAGSRSMVDAWQRHRFFEGLARALFAVERPLLLVLDNVQWCDQETLAFMTFLMGLAPDAPVMLAATRRDDDLAEDAEIADWTVRMRASGLLTEFSLGPLDISDTARLATAIAGRPLAADDVRLLQETTGGFPLYIIEAIRVGADAVNGATAFADLAKVLESRLGQATPVAREIAGLAAAVGRTFTLDLLTEASDLPADTVVTAVDELWRRRLFREIQADYDFSHDLLRETAYQQVSPPKRWLLHRRLAQSLELLHSGDIDPVSAQLADQYARGGRPDRAVTYYRRAADVAAAMFAHAESIRATEEALAIVRSQQPGRERDRRELDLLEAMAAPLTARYGYASGKLEQTLERTLTIARRLGRRESTVGALLGLWTSRFVQGRIAHSFDEAESALALVDAESELAGSVQFALAGSAVSLGRPSLAVHHFTLAGKLTAHAHSWTIGTRPDVHGRAFEAHAQWLLGRDDEARLCAAGAIELARTIDHPYSLAVALAYAGITYQLLGDLATLTPVVEELGELCKRYSFAYYCEWVLVLSGWTREPAAGLQLARRGINNLKAEGSFARMPYWLALLADLQARGGQTDSARATLDAALVSGRSHQDLWWLPEVTRLRAAYEAPEQAVARLQAAASMARDHGSIALLRRCERDLRQLGVR